MSNLSQAISEMRNMRESYSQIAGAAEAYNAGKLELVQNINAKGVPASASDSLPELAAKVAQIAQTETILDGGEVMAAQQFGDGALWNLYQVLADMKTRFMGTGDYAALIVCEYYKGYDNLVLQGADGYYTCDGDYYDYASPNHVWHDADNGKLNRWVAFLYYNAGARLDITNTDISPRSMYIGGHIGTIEYFINGRLTELVCGVEETDVVDNLNLGAYTQEFNFKNVIRNIKGELSLQKSLLLNGLFVYIETDGVLISQNTGATTTKYLQIKASGYPHYSQAIRGDALEYFVLRGVREVGNYQWHYGEMLSYCSNLKCFDMRDLEVYYNASLFGSPAADIIDVWVGAMETNIPLQNWNPTNVLANTAKTLTLVTNIRDHIVNRVSDRTGLSGLTFKISSNMKNQLDSYSTESADETEAAIATVWAEAKSIFASKNWSVAGA